MVKVKVTLRNFSSCKTKVWVRRRSNSPHGHAEKPKTSSFYQKGGRRVVSALNSLDTTALMW